MYPKSWWYDLHFLRYRVWQIEISNYGSFFTLLHPPALKLPKIRILRKWKKMIEISSFYTCVTKTTIIWGMVPEIRVGPFFPFYPLIAHKSKILKNNEKIIWRCHNFPHVYEKSQSYDVYFLRYGMWQT